MDPTISPAYIIRSYVWELLKINDPDTWDSEKYGGLIPIVPVAEESELSQYSGPYIVYGYALSATRDLYVRKEGALSFAIYDQNFRRLTKTITILETALGRKDETARDVNEYSSTKAPYLGLTFGYIDLGLVEGGTPETEEGGRQSGLVSVTFEYHVDYDVTTSVV